MSELLSTKLFIPPLRSRLVYRQRLIERVNAGLDRKLTLIAAPAGFGKTSLLSEWIPQSPRCVTWLSLDEGDNDPTRFWMYIIASLQGLRADIGKNALSLLQASNPPSTTSILTALINDLSAFPDSFAVVIDDYHVIDAQPIHEALAFLIDNLPANMNLVVTTRIDPPFPLTRLRARDQLNELRANDLRFTADEAAAFLTQVMGLSLSPEQIDALEGRTEGWIAGLQIAALSMQGRDDVPGFIRSFSGGHRHILGYLAEEVLARQPGEILHFLGQTSILNRLCGPLCDAVTGGSGGQAILEKLEAANLFISPLDDENRWYRYHPLFSEVLQAQLQRTGEVHVHTLHRQAAQWFASQGMLDEAVQHALAGADFDLAAQQIERAAGSMLRKGRAASLVRWLDVIPEDMIRAHPQLSLARGWTFLWGPAFSLEKAGEWAQIARQVMEQDHMAEPHLDGEVMALEALIAADRVDLPLSRELARRALENLPAGSPWRSVTTFCLGAALYAAGEWSAASPVLAEAVQLSQAEGALYTQLIAASFLADIQVYQGHLSRGKEMYQQVLAWSDHGIPQKGALVAHAGLANVLCEQDRLDEALAHVQAGIDQLELVGGPGATLWLYRTLARIQQAKGTWTGALDALEYVYQSGKSAQIPFVMQQAAALRARTLLAQGDLESAASWAASSGLDPDDPTASHSGLRELQYITFARVLAARGLHHQALAFLASLLDSSLAEGRFGSAVEILALQALVLQDQANSTLALERLERALSLAEPEGFVRTFVDEGEPMRRLLLGEQLLLRQRVAEPADHSTPSLLAYVDRLLAAFPPPLSAAAPANGRVVEPLSPREMQIVRLIATGLSNEEIAATLVIAPSTVKSHINSLYGKLGVQRRTQALSVAHDLGLLPD